MNKLKTQDPQKANKTILFLSITLTAMLASIMIIAYYDYNTHPMPHSTPIIKPLEIDVNVQPWYGTIELHNEYDKYGIEVGSPKPNELLITTENVTLKINVLSKGWVIQYAYFYSDLVEDKVHIPINFSNSNWITHLKKTFTINLSNVPDGSHTVDFFVVLHDGTTGIAKINFTIDSWVMNLSFLGVEQTKNLWYVLKSLPFPFKSKT